MEWDKPLPWVQKSLDFMSKTYWAVGFVGMKKIGEQTDKSAIYGRARKADAQRKHLLSSEEYLNQIFDITFAIASDDLIRAAIIAPFGFSDLGAFVSVGREVGKRQAWPKGESFLQQDGLFVGKSSAVAVEMKTGSPTNFGQTLKYLCLLAMEEAATGRKQQLGLLYIVSEVASQKTVLQAGIGSDGRISVGLDVLQAAKVGTGLRKYLSQHLAEVEDVRQRLKVAVCSWREFDLRLAAASDDLAGSDAGGQTLKRLIEGLRIQILWQTGEGNLNAPLQTF